MHANPLTVLMFLESEQQRAPVKSKLGIYLPHPTYSHMSKRYSMAKRLLVKDHNSEIRLFNNRLITVAIIILLLSITLIGRFYFLQIVQHEQYTLLSEKNQFALLPIPPTRGLIYDRNGVILARNVAVFNLEIIPDRIEDMQKTIGALQQIIDISPDQVKTFNKLVKQNNRFTPIPIKIKLDEEEVARFYVNQYRYPGVIIAAELMRDYPYGDLFSNVLGYVGRINEEDIKRLDPQNYMGTNYTGKVGIEKFYEDTLHGKVGYQQVETDANGRVVRVLQKTHPIPGNDLYLTIDSRLQKAAKDALGMERGSVVAINPKTGAVLALVSNPSYDPNIFVKGINKVDYSALQSSPDQPLFNRAIRGQYPLASTIKPFLALEGLATETVTPEFSIRDPGYFTPPGVNHTYLDWKKGGHGTVNAQKAVVISCDTFFYTLGVKLGIRRIDDVLRSFGYGEKTDIDMGEELGGLVPTPEWKIGAKGEKWYLGDTISASIGQGYMLTTPLQMAHAVATLSERGKGFKPYLVYYDRTPKGEITLTKPTALTPVAMPDKVWDIVILAMQQVITQGTARSFGSTPYTVAAKTGTGQRFSTFGQRVKEQDIAKELRDNSMFIVFAPVEDPQIAVAAVVENKHGAAVPVARQVIDEYLLRELPNESVH